MEYRAWFFKVIILSTVFLLSACSQQFEGNENYPNQSASEPNERGRSLYQQQCASCHGASGTGGIGGSLSQCSTCSSTDSLIAKIEKDMPSPANPLKGADAQNVAEYIYNEFNHGSQKAVRSHIPGLERITPKEAIYKIALELAGRLPTDEEVRLYTEHHGSKRDVVFHYMESDYFYERLKEVFNDSFLTDAYRDENNPRKEGLNNVLGLYRNQFRLKKNINGSNLDSNLYTVFPDINWYSPFVEKTVEQYQNSVSSRYLQVMTHDALARKPLLLVEYLARNNRDFRELITAKYTVVNRFSFEAFNNGEQGMNAKVVDPDYLIGNGAAELAYAPQWKTWGSQQELLDYLSSIQLYYNAATNEDINEDYILRDFPYDPRDLKPVQLYYNDESGAPLSQGVPHSGVLTDEVFLSRYTAMETNMHRHRARMIYMLFAGKDILALEGNRDASQLVFESNDNQVGFSDPTNSNPDCMACHVILDPVAKAFEDYKLNGIYDIRNSDQMELHDDIIGWGLSGVSINLLGGTGVNYTNRELQWLGEQIAADPAYAKGLAQIVVRGLFGQDILSEPGNDSTSEYRLAYQEQSILISNAASELIRANYNIKELIYVLTQSAHFQADALSSTQLESDFQQVGAVRLLPPQLLNQKLKALNSKGWGQTTSSRNKNTLNLQDLEARQFLGGKNSSSTLADANSVAGVIASGMNRLVVEEACDIVYQEFSLPRDQRLLLGAVEDTFDLNANDPQSRAVQMTAIRNAIVHLYLALLHQEVALDSTEVDIAFDLFLDVLYANVDTRCYTGGNIAVREAWYAVLIHLMNDYRFIFG